MCVNIYGRGSYILGGVCDSPPKRRHAEQNNRVNMRWWIITTPDWSRRECPHSCVCMACTPHLFCCGRGIWCACIFGNINLVYLESATRLHTGRQSTIVNSMRRGLLITTQPVYVTHCPTPRTYRTEYYTLFLDVCVSVCVYVFCGRRNFNLFVERAVVPTHWVQLLLLQLDAVVQMFAGSARIKRMRENFLFSTRQFVYVCAYTGAWYANAQCAICCSCKLKST